MAFTELRTRIVLRNDVAAKWVEVNPTLLKGEIGVESDTNKIKIGDGSRAWNSLPYFVSSADAVVDEILSRIALAETDIVSLKANVKSLQDKDAEIELSIKDLVEQLSAKADVSVVSGLVSRVEGLETLVGSRPEGETKSVFELIRTNKNSIDGVAETVAAQAGLISGLDGRVATVEGDLAVLKGTGEGSVSKTVADAIDAWAKAVTDNETIDTIKEVIDYVADHKGEATTMMADIQGLKEKDQAIDGQIAALTGTVNGKVDKKEGYDLVSNELIEKLQNINIDGEANYIKSVSNEFVVSTDGQLTLNKIAMSKVDGLENALALAGKIDGVQVNGNDLPIVNKKVNVVFNEQEFSYADNKVSVNKISLSKLENAEEGVEIILNGGNA